MGWYHGKSLVPTARDFFIYGGGIFFEAGGVGMKVGQELTGAEILLEMLQAEGVRYIFGYPGGANLPIYQHMVNYPSIKHVLVRHEQGAAHMADGYARATGKPGICMATSGPGALNLVTGIATAMMDSVPVIAITGQVPSSQIGRDAFQESDIIGVTMPITKHSFLVTKVDEIAKVIKEAFYIATTGRPGPVLIDICRDAQQAKTIFKVPERIDIRGYKPTYKGNPRQIKKAAEALRAAKRPLILAGHGVILANAQEELLRFAEACNIPVGTTLLGVGAFPVRHPLSLHMAGFMGTGYCNHAISETDTLLMIGMRVDDRVTTRIDSFAPKAQTIIHVDIDPSEIGKNLRPTIPIVGDAKTVLKQLMDELPSMPPRTEWLTLIERWKEEFPLRYPKSRNGFIQPQEVLEAIYARCEDKAIVVADVGQNQIWAALWWNYSRPGLFMNSGGSGTMGFAFPASIGAKFGRPDLPVWCITGEGGFLMVMQELSVAVEHNLDLKVAILNNRNLGMVRQFQDSFYGGVRHAVDLSYMPDIPKLADAYGCPGYKVEKREDINKVLDKAIAYKGPVLIDFNIDPEANVYPIVPLGKGLLDFWEAPE